MAVKTISREEFDKSRSGGGSSVRRNMTLSEYNAFRDKVKDKTVSLVSPDGKVFGDVSYDAKRAIETRNSSYVPKNENEKNILKEYKDYMYDKTVTNYLKNQNSPLLSSNDFVQKKQAEETEKQQKLINSVTDRYGKPAANMIDKNSEERREYAESYSPENNTYTRRIDDYVQSHSVEEIRNELNEAKAELKKASPYKPGQGPAGAERLRK